MAQIDDRDIEELFERIQDHFEQVDEKTKDMFDMLIEQTLEFRKKCAEANGHVLTVGETKQALDAFMIVLRVQKIPANLPKPVYDLIIRWLEALKNRAVQ